MRIVAYEKDGVFRYGLVRDDAVHPIGDPFKGDGFDPAACISEAEKTQAVPLPSVRLLPPCRPSKIVCVGVNYAAHAQEMGRGPPPEEPLLFLKAPSALNGPGDKIVRPPESRRVDHEAELGVVIARRCRHVRAEDAASVIFGYTCVNDVTARDLQKKDVQFTRAKSFDTFCPVGPWIETELSPDDCSVECRVNGEVRQSGRTRDLIHNVGRLVAFISGVMTLFPGDLIATGTPSGVGPLLAGDTVTISIEGIGDLTNPVVDP